MSSETDDLADLLARADAHAAAGRADDALAALHDATARQPTDPRAYHRLAPLLEARGQPTEAVAARCAAMALDARSAIALYNLGTVYFMKGHYADATRWYRLALTLDPELVEANQNLAVIHEVEGRSHEAQRHRDAAFRKQCLFLEPSSAPTAPTVLVLAAGIGNVPIDFLLPRERVARIKWFIDYAPPGQADRLPPHDLVFNAIGDADVAESALQRAAAFAARRTAPLLNAPERVRHTRRDHMPSLLDGIDGLVVPAVRRVARAHLADPTLPDTLARDGIGWPVLVRPVGSHGGKDVVRVEHADALAGAAPADAAHVYLTRFHDARSADGRYRKYRMIFVDRRPYPYHLAIGDHWLVHYFSADMAGHPDKLAEEARFLEDPAGVLGARAIDTLHAVGRRLDLDYGGIDFALLPDGRVLLFEANATMLVQLNEPPDAFPHKHRHIPAIARAFAAMMAARIGGPRGG